MKRCVNCKEDKPFSSFHRNGVGAYRGSCKCCTKFKLERRQSLMTEVQAIALKQRRLEAYKRQLIKNPNKDREGARKHRERYLTQERERLRKTEAIHRELLTDRYIITCLKNKGVEVTTETIKAHRIILKIKRLTK